MRLAILASHPIQYQVPLFRELARRLDLMVFFAHRASHADQAEAGFGVGFEWDIDLLSGYEHRFLDNVSPQPGLDHFAGCDTPSIAEQLSQGRFDALLVMGWHLKSFWQGVWASKRARIPVMVRGDSHLDTPRSMLKRVAKSFIYPIALRVFDIALYVGIRSRQYWEHYGYPEDRLIFSPHCVDNAWFAQRATQGARQELRAQHGVGSDAKVVLFAGKLVPFKRPLDLISAAGALRGSLAGLTVLVAGSGALGEQMASAADATGVDLVHLGFCNQTMMPKAYAAADVLVLPSNGDETWGLVVNEALACGRPVIVSDACGCAPDLAADGLAGSMFPVGNVSLLAKAIADMMSSPPVASAIAEKASRYSIKAAADGVCRGLERVVLRRRIAG
ncbi:MAG: glycosyltransferase family 4 protein [Sulfuricellaceae bacterium]|nr:glycosyltransferase family 4 protein [Sulfuricellaceae bacterium]